MIDNQDGGEGRPPRWFGEAIGVHRELAMLGVRVKTLDEHKMSKESQVGINQSIRTGDEQTLSAAAALIDRSFNSLEAKIDHLEEAIGELKEMAGNYSPRRGAHPAVHQIGGAAGGSGILALILWLAGVLQF